MSVQAWSPSVIIDHVESNGNIIANNGYGASDTDNYLYDYKNPGNLSPGWEENGSSIRYGMDSVGGIAIGRYTDIVSETARAGTYQSGIALGDYARAKGSFAVGIGAYSQATDIAAMAIGAAAKATGFNSLAMMRQSAALGTYSTAIGTASWADAESSFALGYSSTALGKQSIAIGAAAKKVSWDDKGTQIGSYVSDGHTEAAADRSFALGTEAKTSVDATDSLAIGTGARTTAANTLAVGTLSKAQDSDALAFGSNATSSGKNALSMGTSSEASGDNSFAIGNTANAEGDGSLALGTKSNAAGEDSFALGRATAAKAERAIAIGSEASASKERTIAIGDTSSVTGDASIAIGVGANVGANNSIALGTNTRVNGPLVNGWSAFTNEMNNNEENGVIAVGNVGMERRIINVAGGEKDTDAVNVKQLRYVNSNLARSIGGDSYTGYEDNGSTYLAPDFSVKGTIYHTVKEAVEAAQTNYYSVNTQVDGDTTGAGSNYSNDGATGSGALAAGLWASATGTDSVAVGRKATANGGGDVAIGYQAGRNATNGSDAVDGYTHNVFIGNDAGTDTESYRNVAIGAGAQTEGSKGKEGYMVALGSGAVATDEGSISIGGMATSQKNAIAVGQSAVAGKSSIAIGYGSQTTAEKTVLLGNLITGSTQANSVVLGNSSTDRVATTEHSSTIEGITYGEFAGAGSIKKGIVSVGAPTNERQIINVAAGRIAADSTDAINGSQLYATNTAIGHVANSVVTVMGGEARLGSDGTITTSNIGGTGKDTVHDAIQANKTRIDANETNISTNTGNIATNSQHITENAGNIATNTQHITDNSRRISENATTISNVNQKVEAGWEIQYDGTKLKDVTPSSRVVNLKAGTNMVLAGEGDAITISTSKEPTFDVVRVGGNTTISGDGVTISGGPSVTKNGIDAGNKKITNVADGVENSDAVNKGQLDKAKLDVTTNITNTLTVKGINVSGNSGTEAHFNLGETIPIKGEGTKDDSSYSGENIKTIVTTDGTLLVTMDKDITTDSVTAKTVMVENTVTVGKDGVDGKDGQPGSITIIGQPGKDGANGEPGKNAKADITVIEGNPGVDGKDGLNGEDGITRIQYTDRDNNTHEVATLDDGMKYGGDAGTVIKKKLNEQVNVVGGITNADAFTAEDNLGVVSDGENNLKVRLAKELKGLTKVTVVDGTNKTEVTPGTIVTTDSNGSTTVNGEGLTTGDTKVTTNGVTNGDTSLAKDGLTINDGPSITKNGIDAGGKKITNVADGVENSDAVNKGQLDKVAAAANTKVEGSDNIVVDESVDNETKAKTYTVKLKDSITLGSEPEKQISLDGTTGTVSIGAGDKAIVIDAVGSTITAGRVAVDGSNGHVTGLTNTEWDVDNPQAVSGRAATEDQLKKATSGLTTKGINVSGNSGNLAHFNLGETIPIKGEGTKDDSSYSGENIKTIVTTDGTLLVTMDKDITTDSVTAKTVTVENTVTVGKDGVDGKNGQPGYITIIGQPGKDGANGEPGKNAKADITVIEGNPGVDGKDGLNGEDGITRIQYTDRDNNTHEVATLDDGMKYGGDAGTVIKKKLNEQVNVVGGITNADAFTAEDNLGVVSDGENNLKVRLAKELKGLTKVTVVDGTNKTEVTPGTIVTTDSNGSTTVNGEGLTTGDTKVTTNGVTNGDTSLAKDGLTINDGPSITKNGIDAGGKKITNVADGVENSDAVNKGQLDKVAAAANTKVEGSDNIAVDESVDNETKAKIYTVKLKDSITLGSEPEKQISLDGTTGTVSIGAGDKAIVIDAVGSTITAGRVAVDGANGYVTGLTNTEWDVDNPQAVSGRAATEDQLKTVNGKVNTNAEHISNITNTVNAGWEAQVNGTKVKDVTPNSRVLNFNEGKNIIVEGNGDTITVKTIDTPSFTSVTTGDTVINTNGVTNGDISLTKDGLTISGGPSVTKNGIDAGDRKITNVADGVENSDAVNKGQLDKVAAAANTKVDGSDNIAVDESVDTETKAKTYTVKLKDSITLGSEPEKQISLDGTTGRATVGKVAVDGAKGHVTGLTNTEWDVDNPQAVSGRAATEDQLKKATSGLIIKGINVSGNSGTQAHFNLGETISIKGEGAKDDSAYSGENIKTIVKDGTLFVMMDKDINATTVTVGKDGIDGKNGQPGSITIIGQAGKDGANGEPGTNTKADITVIEGKPGVDGTDGLNGKDGITRIQYTDRDKNTHEVATLDDGMKYGGDAGTVIKKKLNEQVNVVGGITNADAFTAEDNLGVVSDGKDNLKVRLAKELKGLTKVTVVDGTNKTEVTPGTIVATDTNGITTVNGEGVTTGNTRVTTEGLTTGDTKVTTNGVTNGDTSLTKDGLTISGGPSVTKNGIDAGDQKITNVADGTNNSDAVNKGQLDKAKSDVTTNITNTLTTKGIFVSGNSGNSAHFDLGETIPIKGEGTKEDSSYSGENIKTIVKDGTLFVMMDKDINATTVTVGKDGVDGKNGQPGSVTIIGQPGKNGADGKPGANARADVTVIEGKPGVDGTNGLNGTDGITRIQYTDRDNNTHEVATLDDGMKYGGDAGTVIKKKLNEQVNVVGGITDTNAFTAEDNLGVVSDGKDNLKVRLAKELKGLTKVTVIDGTNKTEVTPGTIVTTDSNGSTTVNGEGLTINDGPSVTKTGIDAGNKKITNVADGTNNSDAVNKGQLDKAKLDVTTNITNTLTTKGINVSGNSGNSAHFNLGETIPIKGEGTKDDSSYSGENIKTIVKDGTLFVMMDKDINATTVTVGKDGADGKNGQPGSITIIGQPGKDGADGKPGTNAKADITVIEGKPGVDGKDGLNGKDGITRIQYTDRDNDTHEVATLDDGMKYGGDAGTVIKKKLNEQVNVVGGITDSNAFTAEDNLGVVSDGKDNLKVRLAKELKGLTKVTVVDGINKTEVTPGTIVTTDSNGSTTVNGEGLTTGGTKVTTEGLTTGDTKVTTNGVTNGDTSLTKDGLTISGGPSVTKNGIDAGDQKIINVADGVENSDAVNKGQLDKVAAAANTKVEGSDNIAVDESVDNETKAKTYTVKLKDSITLGSEPEKQILLDGTTGTVSIGAGNKAIVIDAVGSTITAGRVAVDGSNGHVTGLTNTEWDVDNPQAVSGRAATEDQLKTVNGKVNTNAEHISNITNTVNAGWEAQVNGTKVKDVTPNSRVLNFSEGKNIIVEGNGDTITVKTTDTPSFTTVTTGDTVMDTHGVTIGGTALTKDGLTISGGPSVTKNGIDAGAKKITNVADGVEKSDAVNKGQLDNEVNAIKTDITNVTNTLTTKGINVSGNSGTQAHFNLGETIPIKGEGTKDDSSYSGKNIKTIVTTDGTLLVTMDKDITTDSVTAKTVTVEKTVTVGKDGVDGKNGQPGYITIIGQPGKDGANGEPGTNAKANITVIEGQPGVNGTDGLNGKDGVQGKDGITRIQYTDRDNNTNEVATLDDGMKYGGDAGTVIKKKLNEQVNVVGGITDTNAFTAEDNLGVVSDGKDNLKVRLAKELKGLAKVTISDGKRTTDIQPGRIVTETVRANTVQADVVQTGRTTLSDEGIIIRSNEEHSRIGGQSKGNTMNVRLTADGLDNGGNRITNVAPGENGTDAVNVDQLKAATVGIADQLGRLGTEVNRVGAHAAAMAALKPLQYDPLEPTQIMAGIGNYRNETAAAVGIAHYTAEDTMFHMGVSVGAHRNMINAGVTHKFGWSPEKKAIPDRYKSGPISSVYVMQDEVTALKLENQKIRQANERILSEWDALKADNESLRKDNEEMRAVLAAIMTRLGGQ